MNSIKIAYIVENGVFLGECGVNEWALSSEHALTALGEVERKNMIVLGGDVLIKNGTKYEHNYDNWCYDPDLSITHEENSYLSVQKTIDYINNYPVTPQTYFTLVLQ